MEGHAVVVEADVSVELVAERAGEGIEVVREALEAGLGLFEDADSNLDDAVLRRGGLALRDRNLPCSRTRRAGRFARCCHRS